MLFMYFRLVNCPHKYITVARTGQPMATKFLSRQNVVVILGAVTIVSLALTIVAFPVALIWIGQPAGNTAITMADVFATVFSVAFFAAFVLAMTDQRPGSSSGPH
jgi:hypothetical protein